MTRTVIVGCALVNQVRLHRPAQNTDSSQTANIKQNVLSGLQKLAQTFTTPLARQEKDKEPEMLAYVQLKFIERLA